MEVLAYFGIGVLVILFIIFALFLFGYVFSLTRDLLVARKTIDESRVSNEVYRVRKDV